MNKKLISLLVAICLVVGLLPVASIATGSEPQTAKIVIAKSANDNIMEVTKGGEPVYGKSVAFEGYKSDNTTPFGKTGYKFTKTGATESDWNFKFEYPQNGVPTLTLKNAKLINMDTSTGDTMYENNASTGSWYAIQPRGVVHDLKIVLEGQNEIQTYGVLRGASTDTNKFSSITIVGNSGSSLLANGRAMGIQGKFGVPVTIENANITMTTSSSTGNTSPIYTENAAITIKNSTLNLTTTKGTVNTIHAEGTGVITVNNSDLTLTAAGAAFNKAPVLSNGWTAVAGDDVASAVTVTDAAVLATKKYVKVTCPTPNPTETTGAPDESTGAPDESTGAPTESTGAPTESTGAPTESTGAPTETTGATLPTEYVLMMADHDGPSLTSYKLTNYDTPVYSKNTTITAGYFTSDDLANGTNPDSYITQRAGTEGDWNAKLIWHTGDEGPTLYLDGFKIDTYSETVGNWLQRGGGSAKYFHCAISTGTTAPLKIVLTGADSDIRNYHGIHYQNKLTIESVGDTKLIMHTRNSGIIPTSMEGALYDTTSRFEDVAGYSLTLNANLDISTYSATSNKTDTDTSYTDDEWNFGIVSTREADLIINGGNIAIKSAGPTGTANVEGPFGMKAKVSGNIIVNGGNLLVEAGYRGVQVWPDYEMQINGGTTAIGVSSSGFYALYESNKASSPSEHTTPVLPANGNYTLWQGSSSDTATQVTALTGNQRYFKVQFNSGEPGASTPTDATSEPTTAPSVTPTAPSVNTTKPTAGSATGGTVTLWGTAVTVNSTNPAYYWMNGTAGGNPVAVTATDNWNYSFSVVDGIPTVTLRNANYSGTEAFLYAKYNGNLRVAYEGTNNIVVPYTNGAKYFITYLSSSNTAGKGHLFLAGAEGAILNVTGGDETAAMIDVSNKAYLTIYGGTINMEKTVANGGVNALISAGLSKTVIQDCTLNVKNLSNTTDKQPAVIMGGSTNGVTITNANVNIETNAHVGLCSGDFRSDMTKVDSPAALTINGNSNIKIVTDSNSTSDKVYSGVGIYASKMNVKSGNLEIEAKKQAVYLSTTNAVPDLSDYDGEYDMFTAKGGTAVTEYTATAYFKVAYTGAIVPSTTPTTAPTTPASTSATVAPTILPKDYVVKIHGGDYGLTGYDTPVYMVNVKKNGWYKGSETVPATDPTTGAAVTDPTTGEPVMTTQAVAVSKEYTTLTKTDANADNYNAKLIWHTGDNGPTLYLRNFVIDDYNEELKRWRYSASNLKSTLTTAAIHTGAGAPLKIVIESGDCRMRIYEGIHYQNELTIEGADDASLTLFTNRTGILPSKLGSGYAASAANIISGHKLTLDVNLKVTQTSWSNADYGKLIRTVGADMIINGGNIITEYTGAQKSCRGIAVLESGNLYINGGYVYSESYNGANHTEAAIEVSGGNIYVTGGEVEAISANQSGLRAKNIYISGGTVKTRVNYTSLLVTDQDGVISFTGGLLDVQGGKLAAYNDSAKSEKAKDLVLKEGGTLQGWVGPNPFVLSEYAGEFKLYNKLSYGPVEKNEMPVPTPGGEIPLKTIVTIGGKTYELKKYDDDVIYTVNIAVDAVDKDGNAFTRWNQTTTGANEDNWNAKFVWHSTDSAPTLYLRGFKMDHWNEETNKFAWNTTSEKIYTVYPIVTGSAVPMIIKLTGEDSVIESNFGIHYNNNLTILSEGNTKLTMTNQSSNISSVNAEGFTLTVNANLNLYIRSLYNSTFSGGALMNKGPIIVNGGTIVCDNGVENRKDVNGIVARGEDSDLIINGGNITAVGSNGAGHRNGALQANGMLIINGGTVNLSAKRAVGMNGYAGIEINGGVVNIMSPWYGITTGYGYRNESGKLVHVTRPCHINGGTLTVMSEKAFFTGSELTIGEGMMAYAGAGKKNAEVYDGTDQKLALKPWFFATDDESKFLVIEEEEEEDDEGILDAPTAPTTADGTGAPSDATGIPGAPDSTDATTPEGENPEGENPEDEIPEEQYWDSNIYVDYVEGDMDVIPDALIDMGFDSVDLIWEEMLNWMWEVDEYINRVSFFDAVPWFYDGEEWIFADETHLPEDGFVTVVLPYPEGTDMDTEFTALHMFTTDLFGMIPGDVELLVPVNTEDGIELELTGLSPVMLGWVDYNAEDEINPPTGDADVTMYFTMLLFSVLGMATVVILNKKRAV